MNLPKVITDLIQAQNNYDSVAYANCFSATAVVIDEGKMHQGKAEIQDWITAANQKYKTLMKPLAFTQAGTAGVLSAEISGSFPGSPIVLNYHLELNDSLIQSLKISG